MKGIFLILGTFVAGVLFSALFKWDIPYYDSQWMIYLLYLLLLLVGLSVGSSGQVKKLVSSWRPQWILLPISTILGTYIGILLVALLLPSYRLTHLMAIGSGMGYYSLSLRLSYPNM